MRHFSNVVYSLLNNDEVSIFTLVAINLNNGGNMYHTTLPYDVTIAGLEGSHTFIANNNLEGVEAPRLSNVVDREAYKITYTDNEKELIDKLITGAVGSPCRVYFGFFNTTNSTIDGCAPGEPILSANHIVLGYKGILDTYGYTIDSETDIRVTLECSSPMASLDLVNTFMTTDDAMRRKNPNDDSFSQVYIGSSNISLVWGKAAGSTVAPRTRIWPGSR